MRGSPQPVEAPPHHPPCQPESAQSRHPGQPPPRQSRPCPQRIALNEKAPLERSDRPFTSSSLLHRPWGNRFERCALTLRQNLPTNGMDLILTTIHTRCIN